MGEGESSPLFPWLFSMEGSYFFSSPRTSVSLSSLWRGMFPLLEKFRPVPTWPQLAIESWQVFVTNCCCPTCLPHAKRTVDLQIACTGLNFALWSTDDSEGDGWEFNEAHTSHIWWMWALVSVVLLVNTWANSKLWLLVAGLIRAMHAVSLQHGLIFSQRRKDLTLFKCV